MCKAIEEMVEKERAEAKQEVYVKMRKNGVSIEQIAEMVGIPQKEIRALLNE